MKHILLYLTLLFFIPVFSQYKNQSIGFKENKGQIIDQKGKPNKAVKYLLNSGGLNVQLRENGFSYDIYEVKKTPILHSETAKPLPYHIPKKDKETKPEYSLEYIFHRIDIDFLNSNSRVELITDQESKDFDNYYNVPNKPEGILGVHQYKQITYKNIYPNIDVVFTIPTDPKKTVEYNFVIHPKGKISDIQLKFNGAETELVNNKIQMNIRFGKMEETLPASWTEEGNTKKEIAVGYTKIRKDVYGFETSHYVSDKTVIIDPVPVRLWGTFYGDDGGVHFTDIDSDKNGNIYFSGNISQASSIYASSGAYQTSSINSSLYISDAIIAKFDSNGNRVWGTYYGGMEADKINGLVIDKQGDLVVVGSTYSFTNIATTNSFKPIKTPISTNSTGDNIDAFIVKFNSSGVRLWGTYFGDFEDDSASDVDIDINNNIYVIGKTNSTKNISVNNNFQTNLNRDIITIPDRPDAFLAKFNSNGNLIWSTYAGGEDDDYFTTIKISKNYLVIGGNSRSFTHISTQGVFQENKYTSDPSNDGTIYKFTLNGERLWSTYYSGERAADIESIEIDDEDNVYVGGSTYSLNNIATPGSFDDNSDYNTGFFAKLNANGQRIWGSYLGYSTDINSIKFKNNSIYISGQGSYDPSIITPCAYRKNNSEGYLGKFTKNCELVFGTLTGGNSYPFYQTNKICFDNNNDIIIGGDTEQNNGIADTDSYQSNINGYSNFYLIKFHETESIVIPELKSNSPICIGNSLDIKASGGTNYSWTGPNGFTSTDQNPIIANANSLNSGEYSCTITGTGGCDDTKKIDVVVGDFIAPIPNLATLPTITGDCHTTISTSPTATDACAGAITATTASPLSYTLPGTYTIVWNYSDGNGNSKTQNQTVTITSQPLPTATSPQTFCVQENATLDNIDISTGQNIIWYDSATVGNILPATTPLENKTYYVTQTNNNCESNSLGISIKIQDTQVPIANPTQSFCIQQNATINTVKISGQNIQWYTDMTAGTNLSESTPLENGITYYASQTITNCESKRTPITIQILGATTADCINYVDELPFPKFFTPNNDGFNDAWTIDFAYLKPNTGIRIYDRYGKLIKELATNTAWDGNFLNQPLPSTDYWFVVTRLNGAEFKSHFSLKR